MSQGCSQDAMATSLLLPGLLCIPLHFPGSPTQQWEFLGTPRACPTEPTSLPRHPFVVTAPPEHGVGTLCIAATQATCTRSVPNSRQP